MKTAKSPQTSNDPDTKPMYGVTISETGYVYLMVASPDNPNEIVTTQLDRSDWAEFTAEGYGLGLSAETESGFLILKMVDIAFEITDILRERTATNE
jgi:hypothetical protein